MQPKEIVKQFKAAPWTNRQELDQFLLRIDPELLDADLIGGLLGVLTNRRLAADAGQHKRRCHVFNHLASQVVDPSLFFDYVEALRGGDPELRAVLVPLLPQVNDFDHHAELCALLKSSNPEVRRAAAQVLSQVGGKTALRVIGEYMRERDFIGRSETLDLVMRIAGPHAIQLLAVTLEVAPIADKLKALRYLGDPRFMARAVPQAMRTIYPAFDDPADDVAGAALVAFGQHCTEDEYFEHVAPWLDNERPAVVGAAVRAIRRFCSPRVIHVLDKKLRSGPHSVRLEVLDTLDAIGSTDGDAVLPPLVDALGHKHIAVRTRAGQVLSRLSSEGKVDVARVILWLLRSRDVNVRRIAVEVAQSVEDPDNNLWPKLLRFLRDEDWWVRERVMDALVQMAGKKLTPHMIHYLSDPFDVVRRFAIDVLTRLEDPSALGALVRTAQADEDWWAREKAVEAVSKLGDERAVPYIVELMNRDPEIRIACLDALGQLKARSAVAYMAEMLGDKDADVRLAALRALEAVRGSDYAAQVRPLMNDESREVARLARDLLVTWNVRLADGAMAVDQAISFLDRLLIAAEEADDLILAPGRRPYMKRLGKTVPLHDAELSAEQVRSLLTPHLSTQQLEELGRLEDVDFSYEVRSRALRFRANIFHQRGGLSAVFRAIRSEIPKLENLGLPEIVTRFADFQHGLVLVGGPTGSGKSTTLAALIDYINRTSGRHVISLEDPIEVVHPSQRGLVNQREVGTHTGSFANALRSTLREDPDVILVGEMRDLDTIKFAVTAADTGHLVFGTVHTASAHTTVDRLINAFPAREQDQVRVTLSENLRAVLCQYLIKKQHGSGRVLACEVMIRSDAVSNLVRRGKTYQLPSIIATGRDHGMQLMDQELMRLFKEGVISLDEAYMKATNKKELEVFFEEQEGKEDLGPRFERGNGRQQPQVTPVASPNRR